MGLTAAAIVTAPSSSPHYNRVSRRRLVTPQASSSAVAADEPATSHADRDRGSAAIPGKSSTGPTTSDQVLACRCSRASNSRTGVPPAESLRKDITTAQDEEERSTSTCPGLYPSIPPLSWPHPTPTETPVIHDPQISEFGSLSITTGFSDMADASPNSFTTGRRWTSAYNDPEYKSVASTDRESPVSASSVGISMAVVASAAVYGAAMVWLARRYRRRKRQGVGTISGPVTTTNSLGWAWT